MKGFFLPRCEEELVEGKSEWWSMLRGQTRGQERCGYQGFPLTHRACSPAAVEVGSYS